MDNRQNALIEVEGLKKFYKNRGTGGLFKKKKMVQAVGGVSFEIRKARSSASSASPAAASPPWAAPW